MMVNDKYLPLFQHDSSWIERPDLYLFALMGTPDKEGAATVQQIYSAMLGSNPSVRELNDFELGIQKRHIGKDVRQRVYAGEVLLELVRLAGSTGRPPRANQAYRLAAFHEQELKPNTTTDTLERSIRKGFSDYRNTSHLQAAMVLRDPPLEEIENSPENTVRFLARARGFEMFIDANVAGPDFKWDPWRVPKNIAPATQIDIDTLTHQERAIAQVE
jgi:hypothetical protein